MFYITPKIHKPSNPGRAVTNSIDCHTSEISRFVNHHLQPVVKPMPSYIKNTHRFINKVKNFSVPVNSKNIHKTLSTKTITTFLALILTLNKFLFNSKFYLNTKGRAASTICAPASINICMAEFE